MCLKYISQIFLKYRLGWAGVPNIWTGVSNLTKSFRLRLASAGGHWGGKLGRKVGVLGNDKDNGNDNDNDNDNENDNDNDNEPLKSG